MSLSNQKLVGEIHIIFSNDCTSSIEAEQQRELLKLYTHLITQAFLPASSVEAQDNELLPAQPQGE